MTIMDMSIHTTPLPLPTPRPPWPFHRDVPGFEVRKDVGSGEMRWIGFEWVQASGAEVVQEPMEQYWGTATARSATPPATWSASRNCADRLTSHHRHLVTT